MVMSHLALPSASPAIDLALYPMIHIRSLSRASFTAKWTGLVSLLTAQNYTQQFLRGLAAMRTGKAYAWSLGMLFLILSPKDIICRLAGSSLVQSPSI